MTNSVTIDFDGYPKSPAIDIIIGNTYYYTDDLTNEQVEITLTVNPPNLSGYEKLEHKPKDPKVKIKGIQYSTIPQNGFPPDLSRYESVTVYCWGGDSNYKPIVVRLGSGDDYYKGAVAEDSWNPAGIKSSGLLNLLENESCRCHSAHILDISKKGNESYDCSACKQQNAITLHSETVKDYKRVAHTPGGFVGRLKNGQDSINSIPITRDISDVYVYWYPKDGGKSGPLLIYFSLDSAWIKRVSKASNEWTPTVEDELDNDDSSKILKLLKKIKGNSEGPSAGDIAGYVAEGLTSGGVGTEAYNFFFNPNRSATRQIIRLLTMLI
ncbi:hypothetical protein BEWA_001770 [Theileria equi strain WA]|uniref:Uncharacterized protein n=1 Tax=Theileria equi strain WA TaxID=1537102 RepID=L0AYX7_THEEQ|nr:hypothetical protein BEWA_001770 [Theileria equi strain WA]AFZ80770.1 hypothetical protein BEWA_001770 [Theileria equi strain WA]|eukprot:XP_004830436.1 hypothetical protein BEWA_001770 [Theileria equi strain WA]